MFYREDIETEFLFLPSEIYFLQGMLCKVYFEGLCWTSVLLPALTKCLFSKPDFISLIWLLLSVMYI